MSDSLAWLFEVIIEPDLQWERADDNLETLLSTITIHDAYWIGVFALVAYGNSVVLLMELDRIWLPEYLLPKRGDAGRVFLAIRLQHVQSMGMMNFIDDAAFPRGVAGYSIEESDHNVYALTVTDHYGGTIKVDFGGPVAYLLVDSEHQIKSICRDI